MNIDNQTAPQSRPSLIALSSNESSGESVQMHRLTKVFTSLIDTKYGYRWGLGPNLGPLAPPDMPARAFIEGMCAYEIITKISCTGPVIVLSVIFTFSKQSFNESLDFFGTVLASWITQICLPAVLNRKFHISQVSHCVKNWYQNVTFGKCEICVWSISIILGV